MNVIIKVSGTKRLASYISKTGFEEEKGLHIEYTRIFFTSLN